MTNEGPPSQLRVLDLFSGTGSATQAFADAGHDVFRIDIDSRFPADLHADILDLAADDILSAFPRPDFIWASPPCTTFSVGSIYNHWTTLATCSTCDAPMIRASYGKWEHRIAPTCDRPQASDKRHYPKTEASKQGLALLSHTLSLINDLDPRFFVIENPRAMMRKMPELAHLERRTITHCQYGDPRRMKPTDLFGVFPPGFTARSCKNGDTCHASAPRGAKTGTQGLSKIDAGMMPPGLGFELMTACESA